ncbi:MAG: hypothetical protein A2Z20_10295 [Bdellovibrionales bacterium RBG_16_40_8]|nr:MAG: hypothetical protein A2Z20_10295 [Bdellovibrionales bacterium RBG_16_40_8]
MSKKLKILVAEDDNEFREALVGYLKSKNFEVIGAANGRVARDIIPSAGIDLLITDVQMPFMDGVELLSWVKKNQPVPVIIMTGFSHLFKTQSAIEYGADAFLSKPFESKEMLETINSIIKPKDEVNNDAKPKENEKKKLENAYCKVSIDEFISMQKLLFDVYIQIADDKYIRIGNKGYAVLQDQMQKFKEKGIKHLHIRREDFSLLVNFNMIVGKKITGAAEVSAEKKANFIKYAGEVILEKCFVIGVDQKAFDDATQFSNLALSSIADSYDLVNILDLLGKHSDDVYAHSLGVSLYSVMIARQLGWISHSTLFKLSLAGMFHDIGEKEIDKAILKKSRIELTQEERKLIESHPVRGKEILESLGKVPSDVILAIYEHHERARGQGYPRNLELKDISPFGKVLAVADCFVKRALKTEKYAGISAQDALTAMDSFDVDLLDQDIYAALKRAIQGHP